MRSTPASPTTKRPGSTTSAGGRAPKWRATLSTDQPTRTRRGPGPDRGSGRGSHRRGRASAAGRPTSRTLANTAAADAMAASHGPGSRCCDPTWKLTPAGSRPSRRAWVRRSAAIAGSHPNLPLKGQSAPAPLVASRQHDRRPRGLDGQLVQLGLGVEREPPHAQVERTTDVGRLLDRVPVGQPPGATPRTQAALDLRRAGHVEARPQRGEEVDHRGFGIGLDRVVDGGGGQPPAGGRSAAPPLRGRGRGRAWTGGARRGTPPSVGSPADRDRP